MPGYTNRYIEKLMYKISTKPGHFKGVHACDIFLDKVNKKKLLLKEKSCFIINLSLSNHGGSHFVCLLVMPGKVIEYFNSFFLHLTLTSTKRWRHLRLKYSQKQYRIFRVNFVGYIAVSYKVNSILISPIQIYVKGPFF